jgi:hypothetical protein
MISVFHGLKMHMPEGWNNASTLVYVAPPSETYSLPTTAKQDPMAQGSLVVTPMDVSEDFDVQGQLQAIASHLSHEIPSYNEVERFEENTSGKQVAGLISEQSEPFPVMQVYAIVKIGSRGLQVVASAPKTIFQDVKLAFDAFLESLGEA